MRVDTTVVETDIHHPTDSTLLGDGVRVLTRIMRKIATVAGAMGTKLRDRSRSVKLRLLEIGRVARAKGPVNQDQTEAALSAVVGCNGPGRGTGEALLRGDRPRSEAVNECFEATGAGRPAPRA